MPFDGFKVSNPPRGLSDALSDPNLTSISIDPNTAEMLPNKSFLATAKGLTHRYTPTQENTNVCRYEVFGSLHKYKNNGGTNADDFTLSDFRRTIEDLNREFGIEPTTAILENLEFGVNITLPIGMDCDFVLSRMISGAHDKFSESESFMRVIKNARCWVKIYDKKRQERNGKAEKGDNILRVEVKVKRMSFFEMKRFENAKIRTLSDLLDPYNLKLLGKELASRFQSIVIHDEKINEISHYSPNEQIKVLKWINPNFWADITDIQRLREKEAFAEFQKRGNTGNLKNYLINAVSDKWDELLNITPSVDLVIGNGLAVEKVETVSESGNGFSNKCPTLEAEKVETVSSGNGFKSNECPIKINKTFIKENKQQEKGVQGEKPNITNLKVCDNCGVDISHKRPQTLFCSPKCKNDKHNKMRDRRKVKAIPSVVEPNHVPKATPSVVEPNHVPKATPSVVEPFDIMAAVAAMAGKMKM